MRNLEVYIECNGNMINVGSITGHNSDDAVFSYSEEYIEDKSSRAISISLPLDERSFSPERTRCFFESLLPEGYTRRCVAGWLHVDENDYISVLSELGSECLGAIRIVEGDMNITESSYRLLSHEELLEFAREGATKSAELVIKSHLSLAGASGKTGLYYDRNNNEWYQPAGLAPSTHILKQSHVRGLQTRPNISNNPPLSLPANLYILRGPFFYRHRVFAEHSFTGTRNVGENYIKKRR